MRVCSLPWTLLLLLPPAIAQADGLVDRLPDDGAWAKFAADGQGIGPAGEVNVAVTGTVTLSSVGQEVVDGERCRWIEIKSEMMFQRDKGGEAVEISKLLIPERYLTRGEDPLEHVVKAWRKHSMVNGGAAQQLDSKGGEVRGLDEFLHAPTWKVTELEPEAVDSKLGTAPCKGLQCVDSKRNGGLETRLTVVGRLDERAPFGVVTYEYKKERLRDGKSLGKRAMTLTLSDFGRDAVSDLRDNR